MRLYLSSWKVGALESTSVRLRSTTRMVNPRSTGLGNTSWHWAEEGIVLLGVPMPNQHHYIHARLDDQLLNLKEKAKRILEYAKHTKGRRQQYRTRIAFRLLRQSFNSKWNHHARCLPPALMKRHAEEFDKLVQKGLFPGLWIAKNSRAGDCSKTRSISHRRRGPGLKSLAANADVTYLSAWNDIMREVKEVLLPQTTIGGMTAEATSRR